MVHSNSGTASDNVRSCRHWRRNRRCVEVNVPAEGSRRKMEVRTAARSSWVYVVLAVQILGLSMGETSGQNRLK
jgi:hypothetical protein